jgi:hypothetical protein
MNRYGYGYPLGIMFGGIFAEAWAAYNARATDDGANAIEQSAQDCLFARYVNILNYL